MGNKIFYKRNLPHFQPDDAIFFVTFRLANSLPKTIVEEMKKENELIEKSISLIKDQDKRAKLIYNQRKKYFGKFDKQLDNDKSDSLWLSNNKVAKLVSDAIHFKIY